MLAHVGHLAADPGAEVADRELADGERLEDAQAFRVRQGPTDRGVPLAIGLCRDRQDVQHGSNDISVCANTQVVATLTVATNVHGAIATAGWIDRRSDRTGGTDMCHVWRMDALGDG